MVSPSYSACADGDATGVKSIMVLDEDEESRTALEQSLDELGHRTTLFLSPSDRQIPEFDFTGFDLVICDLDKAPGSLEASSGSNPGAATGHSTYSHVPDRRRKGMARSAAGGRLRPAGEALSEKRSFACDI